TGSNRWLWRVLFREFLRLSKSNHGRIRIELRNRRLKISLDSDVLEWPGDARRLREPAGEWVTTLDNRFTPYILLHSMVRRDPGAAGLAPARRTCNRHFHSELVAQSDRILEGVLPFRSHVRQALRH